VGGRHVTRGNMIMLGKCRMIMRYHDYDGRMDVQFEFGSKDGWRLLNITIVIMYNHWM
jgi:hypothetical protein